MYDCIIVGAGVAGLSAALTLGRSRRQVLVCDAGNPRNEPAHAAHNFFSRDGIAPLELLRIGREQLATYPKVELKDVVVAQATRVGEHFEVTLGDGSRHSAARLLLATGVRDVLPPIEGMAELWGKSVVHCPYCHGWEVQGEPLAAYGAGEMGYHVAVLISGWSDDLVLCTDGPAQLSDEQRDRLGALGIGIREEPIERLVGDVERLQEIVFAGGETLPRRAMFMPPPQQQRSELAAKLGCEFTEAGYIVVDPFGQTSVAGVYAAGDATTMIQSLAVASAGGMVAAAGLNRELIFARAEAAYSSVAV